MNYHQHYFHKHQRSFLFIDQENQFSFSFRMLNRDAGTNRITSLRMPTMGVYVPNMYLTQSNTNGNISNTDNQHVLVGN